MSAAQKLRIVFSVHSNTSRPFPIPPLSKYAWSQSFLDAAPRASGVTWRTAGGRTNRLQGVQNPPGGNFTNNFVDLPLPEVIVPGNGDVTISQVDPGAATNTPAHYYRIRLVP